jgi:hypothetical protein
MSMSRGLAIVIAGAVLMAASAYSAESPSRRGAGGMPKGSFTASCSCAMSGGQQLMCYCANQAAKLFQTSLDLRACPGPKDIKNCDGRLTCTESATAQCPARP